MGMIFEGKRAEPTKVGKHEESRYKIIPILETQKIYMQIQELRDKYGRQIIALAKSHGVSNIRVFGSKDAVPLWYKNRFLSLRGGL